MRLLFDIETNGLLDTLDKIWCIETKDPDTGERRGFGPDNIEEGLQYLMSADTLIGHNIICFDIPALKKCYPQFNYTGEVLDTLNISRLIWTNLRSKDVVWLKRIGHQGVSLDFTTINSNGKRRSLIGSHSLEAWGFRLGVKKDSFGKQSDAWDQWTPELQSYCAQDVDVLEALWRKIESKKYSDLAIWIECNFQHWICLQEQHGWAFRREAAVELYARLSRQRNAIHSKLQELFPPYIETFTPKASNRRYGYVKGEPVIREHPFNPNSPQQIAERLVKRGWKPVEFTETGQPSTGSDILKSLPWPEARLLAKYQEVQKVLEQLDGWFKAERDGKIHGRVMTNGAVTGRCTHKIIVNVPRVTSPYGKELRSLFTVPDDPRDPWTLLGVDAKGLELRCLAHYMAKFDDGEYVRIVTTGDPHTENQKAAGLPDRDKAKIFIYAFIYGGQKAKIGSIIGKGSVEGAKLMEKFYQRFPALKQLKEALQKKLYTPYINHYGKKQQRLKKDAYVKTIDGRHIYVTSGHTDLNYLLQSSGAIIVKLATIYFCQEMTRRGFVWGRDWAMVGHFHDEFQVQVRERLVEAAKEVALVSFAEAGKFLRFRCPIEGDVKVGRNWAETH